MATDVLLASEPILLATNGTKESDAAVDVAGDLSSQTARSVRVIAVLEPPPIVAGPYGFIVPSHTAWADRRATLLDRVRTQINDVVGSHADWSVESCTSHPAKAIADAAHACNAALIVMGLGRHAFVDRALGSETAIETLRRARTPILAVPDTYVGLPTRAVVGVDFSDASLAAARRACVLLPSLTRMTLVQVAPHWDLTPGPYAEWRAEYERAVAPGLEWTLRELDAPANVTVTTEVREGKPTRALLVAAEDYGADVIVVGSKGLGLLDRMVVGSTASGIIRSSQTAVFAFPVAALAESAPQAVPEAWSVVA